MGSMVVASRTKGSEIRFPLASNSYPVVPAAKKPLLSFKVRTVASFATIAPSLMDCVLTESCMVPAIDTLFAMATSTSAKSSSPSKFRLR